MCVFHADNVDVTTSDDEPSTRIPNISALPLPPPTSLISSDRQRSPSALPATSEGDPSGGIELSSAERLLEGPSNTDAKRRLSSAERFLENPALALEEVEHMHTAFTTGLSENWHTLKAPS